MKSIIFTFFFLSVYFLMAQEEYNPKDYYNKSSYQIEMRDGVKLYTIVYSPKNTNKTYPILMQRTCYSAGPYGKDEFRRRIGPNQELLKKGYIFVYQDVRGRYMSEGEFDNMRPHIKGNNVKNTQEIDESSDTYDTIEWLLNNIQNHNGKVGQWGISYPGFYAAAALPEAHPALVASSPQAPIGDFYFDDFHHNGASTQGYILTYPVFGVQTEPTEKAWYTNDWGKIRTAGNLNDEYSFQLSLGGMKNIKDYYTNNFFWNDIITHPDYDKFWQSRNIVQHMHNVDHAVMTVGGWFDAEDLYGPLNIYKNIEKLNKNNKNTIVMGPWSHGDWAREKGFQQVNHIEFGDSLSTFYQREIETPFFEYHLKGIGSDQRPEAFMFDTGLKTWKKFNKWPAQAEKYTFTFGENGKLLVNETTDSNTNFTYVSDPNHPVPYRSEVAPVGFTPRAYMTDDQRHAARRPDVLTFSTDVLEEEITLSGEIQGQLKVMLNGIQDADFVVKIIDVYPDDYENTKNTPKHITLAGYQQLVRAEVMRGRYRDSFSKPKPFAEGKVESVDFQLQDVLHTFKKGHKIMIQIHSTWFPYIDRNPQKWVDNIYESDVSDFTLGKITLMGNSKVVAGGDMVDEVYGE